MIVHGVSGLSSQVRRRAIRLVAVHVVCGVSLLGAGCPAIGPSGDSVKDGNRDDASTTDEGTGEPNDTFATAITATFTSSGAAALQGAVSIAGDKDVFDLGPLNAGTMVTVDAATEGSQLDVTVALFDADENLVFANDDRGGSPARFLDSFALWTTRHDSDTYYLVVAASAFAASTQVTGSYAIDVEVAPEMGVPPPVAQTILLDFSGSFIDSPVLGTMQLEAFDAGRISTAYLGETERMKQLITDTVRQNFELFAVAVYSTDDDVSLDPELTTTVYLGDFNRQVFGLAEDVDQYNFDRCDDAIIYTESFDPSTVFSFTPTVEEISLAIGNIATHEAGHLLGLFHVSDDTALMDDTSPADAFIFDQEFKRAPLSGDVVEIGSQDGAALLYEIVGPS